MLSKQGQAFGLHFILGGRCLQASAGMMRKNESLNIELRILSVRKFANGLNESFGDSARQLSGVVVSGYGI